VGNPHFKNPTLISMIRTYSELVRLRSFEERFEYLSLKGEVGVSTFGFDRYLNQQFYTSREWRRTRNIIISRDNGCDLGVEGHEIFDRLIIHHMNPLNIDDIVRGRPSAIDPAFLITTTHRTHNAIHFGDERQLPRPFVERRPGDTKVW
jgi:hypothetical protein